MLILYGSQTGTAQDVAERIWREAKRITIRDVRIYCMDDYDIRGLADERLIIFLCSTTGQGDVPDNMKQFWRFLCRRSLPCDALSQLFVAVLGLGDSSYQKFNFAAKKLYRRLAQLGAKHLLPLGLADDQHDFGYDAVVESWAKDLWGTIRSSSEEIFGYAINRKSDIDDIWEPKYRVIWFESKGDIDAKASETDGPAISKRSELYSQSNPYFADLIGNDRVTSADHFQETRLVTFSIAGSGIDYLPGDVACIQPKNLDETANEFLSLLGHFNADRPFDLSPTDQCFKRPSIITFPCTLRQCAESYFDISSVPRRSFFELLSRFAPADSLEKEKLMEFCSGEGQEDYFAYCTRPRRTVVETMRDFPQTVTHIPFDYWFDLIGPIRPRSFSIASCLDAHPDEIQILMAVVRYKTRLYGPRLGLCSNWISRLPLRSKVPLWVAKGTIQFPFNCNGSGPSAPCIMIGPGTGVAPFRSFLHWRVMRKLEGNVLIFGCRNEEKDFYFRQEFNEMENKGALKLFTAFSRDQPADDGSKIYVQYRIRENGPLIADTIVNAGAQVFVAGNAKQMPKDVLAALKDVLMRYFESGNENGERNPADWVDYVDQYIAKMEKEKRLQMETWS